MQTEGYCPGTLDFKAIRQKTGAFADLDEEIEIIGFVNCGGCPGKKALSQAKKLIKRGADTIIFTSCIQRGTPKREACPYAQEMKEQITQELGKKVRILDFSH